MSARPADADPPDTPTWASGPGGVVVLRLDASSPGVAVRIARRTVVAARETRAERLMRSPGAWGGVLAGLAIVALVSTAFATGTVRPAPPRAPTPRPGEPTPTPDTRPALSLGGFVLHSPSQVKLVPPAPGPDETQDQSTAQLGIETPEQVQDAGSPMTEPTPSPCTNLFGIGCGSRPPPPQPLVPRQPTQPSNGPQGAVPVASPAARPDPVLDQLQTATFEPPRGSSLATALQAASMAEDNFAREVDPSSPTTPPRVPSLESPASWNGHAGK